MSIIRPPVSGDSPQDSWANQVTEAINKGLLAPSINPNAATSVNVDGFSAATIYLYVRTTSASAPAALNVDLTYNYSTASFDESAPYGSANWQTSPPSVVNGDYLWVITVNISDTTPKEIISSSSWSTPQVFSVNGSSSIVLEVFLRASGSPSTPTGGSYNFSTKTLTAPSGWSATFPSGTDPVYISTTIASVSGTSGTDSSLTWTSPVKMVEDGTPATEVESGLVFYNQASTNNPGTPSASGYNFSTGAFTGLTANWQTTPVTVNITTTTALFWSSRFRVIQAADAGSPTVTFDTPIASVNFGTNIQSDNYISGSSGWQIQRASGNAEFNNVTTRGSLTSTNFNGAFNSLNVTISNYTSGTGALSANNWGLKLGFANNAANKSATSWTDFIDPVSNTDHVVLKIRASSTANTTIISQLVRGQQLTITRSAGNTATFTVWSAGYLPEDANSAYVQLRTIVSQAGTPGSSSAQTFTASNVINPGTTGFRLASDISAINAGTLNVNNIRIDGAIQARNLDIGITLQSKSGSRAGVNTNWFEFLRIETTDSPDFDTDVSYTSQVTVVSEAGIGDIVFVKVLDNSQLGTEGSANYSSSQIGLSVGSTTSFANTIDSASIQANSPNQSSSFTTAMSDSNVNVNRGTIYLFCYRERPGGDTAIGNSASASITEVRRPV